MTKTQTDSVIQGPVLALDMGSKLVGTAVSDDRNVTIKPLAPIKRSNWKRLIRDVESLIERFDAKALVIGLPLRLDGKEGSAAQEITRLAGNLAKSLHLPVYLQDERLTSFAAREQLLAEGYSVRDISKLIDGESAALILRDFLNNQSPAAVQK